MSLDVNDQADSHPSETPLPERDAAWDSDRAAIRARIAAAVDDARPHPIARHTLALLVEAHLARAEGHIEAQALDEAIGVMRSRHPALFLPPEPEPVPAVAAPAAAAAVVGRKTPGPKTPEPALPSSLRPSSAKVVAFAERGRALAMAARTRVLTVGAAVRERLSQERLARAARAETPSEASRLEATSSGTTPAAATMPPAAEVPDPPGVARPASAIAADRLAERTRRLRRGAGDLSLRALDRGRRTWYDLRDSLGDALGPGGSLRRPSLVIVLAGLVLAGLLAALSQGDGDRPSPRPSTAPAAPAVQTPNPEAPPATVPPPPVASQTPPVPARPSATSPSAAPPDDEPAPDDAPMQADILPQAGETAGTAEVVDTATLKIGGRVVRLFGVLWVRGGQTEELTRYLGKRLVTCRTVAGSDAHLCAVDGRDLSEVVLFNGGGRASPEATPDLVAAEDRARTERLGVWAR